MAIDDEELEVRLRQDQESLDSDINRDLSQAAIASILDLIPGIGAAIQSLLDSKASRNVEKRKIQLFVDLKDKLREIQDSVPDATYYSSEEFQTLLALAYEQLLVTHDRDKLKMLASALANSGNSEFQPDDKEMMVRTLRTLSPGDIKILDHENLKGWLPIIKRFEYGHEVLCSLSRLASAGLVVESFPNPLPIPGTEQRTWRTFQLSTFGERFLKFIRESN